MVEIGLAQADSVLLRGEEALNERQILDTVVVTCEGMPVCELYHFPREVVWHGGIIGGIIGRTVWLVGAAQVFAGLKEVRG